MILSASQHVCGTRARLISLLGLILLLHAGSVAAIAGSLTFAGVAFSPGSTVTANVPLSAQEKSLASQGGNAVPSNAVAMLATPSNFDPRKTWPVLVVCSTSDSKRQNRDDLVDFYGRVGLAEGWVAACWRRSAACAERHRRVAWGDDTRRDRRAAPQLSRLQQMANRVCWIFGRRQRRRSWSHHYWRRHGCRIAGHLHHRCQ